VIAAYSQVRSDGEIKVSSSVMLLLFILVALTILLGIIPGIISNLI